MENRQTKRFKRRIQVRFWGEDDQVPKTGFTHNISLAGMFICTNTPFKPGTRIGIEVGEKGHKFHLQGVVRHSARVDPLLQQKMGPSGMGVRLLSVEELMAGVLRRSGIRAVEEVESADEEAPVSDQEEAAMAEEAAEAEPATIQVRFQNPQEFTSSFERDLKFGGLFVPVEDPPETDEIIVLEFSFDWSAELQVRIPARVVKQFAAAEGSIAGEAVSGIGVAFTDSEEAQGKLLEVVESLEL